MESSILSVLVWAASSCVVGAPSSGLTAGSWRGLWLDASQPAGDLRLPARWLWCRATTHRSGRRMSSHIAVHKRWPGNITQQWPSKQLIYSYWVIKPCFFSKHTREICQWGEINSLYTWTLCQILEIKHFINITVEKLSNNLKKIIFKRIIKLNLTSLL